jgi:hypothetical protein
LHSNGLLNGKGDKIMKKPAVLVAAFMVITAGFLYADDTSFRCGSDLIEIGYSMAQVQYSCGAPDSQMVIGQPDRSGIVISQWTYYRDSGAYVLTFRGSTLIKKVFQRLD